MSPIAYSKKIALLGDAQVGKSSLQARYMGLGFRESYTPTLGINFSTKDFEGPEGTIRVLIADMAGQKAFKSLRSRYFTGISGVLLVFDVTRPYDAQDQILPWVEEILEFTKEKGVPLAILANKIDLDFIRQIPMFSGMNATIEAKDRIPIEWPIEYFETSAKDGSGVDQSFEWLIHEIINHIDD